VIGFAQKIEFVCSDVWKPYLQLIEQHCSQALNILERFHIVAKMNKALDEVRAAEARRLVQLKRKESLTDHQLPDLLRYNLKSVRAYLHTEDFQQF